MQGLADQQLSEAEAEQYDRQIRLWGVEAQKRLRGCRVLVCGLTGLTAEVCKNVVLGGIKSLTILDHQTFKDSDIGIRLLVPVDMIGKERSVAALPRLQALNPNVSIQADTSVLEEKAEDYFEQFDIVCVSGATSDTMLKVNEICHQREIKFYCGDTWGYYGYYFVDLCCHGYITEVAAKSGVVDVEKKRRASGRKRSMVEREGESEKLRVEEDNEPKMEKKSVEFCTLKSVEQFDWSKLPAKVIKKLSSTFFIIKILQAFYDKEGRAPSNKLEDKSTLADLRTVTLEKLGLSDDIIDASCLEYSSCELSPVCTIVGGVLAQEMIKAISGKDEPFSNHFIYNGFIGVGTVERIPI